MKLKVSLTLIVCVFLSACRLGGGDPGQIILDGNEAAFAGISADTSTEEIAVTGGEITSTDDRLTLDFPDGALATNTEISVTKLTDTEIAELFPGLEGADFVYQLEPSGYTFLEPITVSYLLPMDADLENPRVLLSVSNGITEGLEDVTYDPETGIVTGTLAHFSEVIALPVGVELDEVPTLELYVGDPPTTVEVEARSVIAPNGAETIPGVIVTSYGITVDGIGGDNSFQPMTASGADRYVTITNFDTSYGFYDNGDLAVGNLSFDVACNEQGIETITYRFKYEDRLIVQVGEFVRGTFDAETEVTCIEHDTPEPPETPETPVQTSVGVDVGSGAEAVKAAGSPPYDFNPEDTQQRFITTSETLMTIFNAAGQIIQTRELFGLFYGAIYMQHSQSGDYFMAYGSDGKSLCLVEGGFCQIDTPVFSNPQGNNTTSAEYGVDANGNEVHNEVYRVRNGIVMHTKEEDLTWQEENVFDNEIIDPVTGFSINATVPLFAYEPLTPSTGVGISAEGNGYFIDLEADTRIEFSDSLGSNLRDIECDQFSPGSYGCAIQSFGDSTITACAGTSAEDFTCGDPIAAGDGVSLDVAVTDAGNLAVVGGDFTDSSLHAIEITPTLVIAVQVEFTSVDLGPLNLGLASGIGHVALIPGEDAVVLTGNSSGNAQYIPLDDLAELDVVGAIAVGAWMGGAN